MTNEEIRATFLGQTVDLHDGWNNHGETSVVTNVEMHDDSITLCGERGNRNYDPKITLSKDCIEGLLLTGKYVSHHEIDHCPYDVTIQLIPTEQQQFEQRIERIKTDIKRLKQELNQAQKDYENYLVSSFRIEVMKQNNELNRSASLRDASLDWQKK